MVFNILCGIVKINDYMKNPPSIFIIGLFWWKDTFFQQKIIPSSNEKLEKKMQNVGETFLLICDFLHYVECNALGSKTSQKRGRLLLGIPQSKAIHHLA